MEPDNTPIGMKLAGGNALGGRVQPPRKEGNLVLLFLLY
jgi:hypothetical protein